MVSLSCPLDWIRNRLRAKSLGTLWGVFLLRLFEGRTHPERGQDLLRRKLCLFPVCLPVCALRGLHLSCCSCSLQWQCCCMNSDMQPSLFSLPTWLPMKPPGLQHKSRTAEAFSLVVWVITAFLMWRHPLLDYPDYTMLSSLINPFSIHIHSVYSVCNTWSKE